MAFPIPQRASLRVFKPSAAQERYISNGLAFLQMTGAFWAHIVYTAMDIKCTRDVPYAATDSHTIFVNPDAMMDAKWGIEEVAFVFAHEACHWIFGDLFQMAHWRQAGVVQGSRGTLPYDHDKMNRAQDYRINAALIDGKVGKFPKVGMFDPTLSAKGMESAVEIYEKMPDDGGNGGGDGFDIHLEPDDTLKTEDAKTGELRKLQVLAGAIQAHKSANNMGNLPGALQLLIGELMDPKVHWASHLRAEMQRASGDPGMDWSRLDKRLITRPERIVYGRRTKFGCGPVVIAIDTSGSVFGKTTEFLSEAAGIVADLNPERVVLLWCDAKIGRVDDLEEPEDLEAVHADLKLAGPPGGGGTRFEPVFDWVHENGIQPDMLCYLTDTYGSFPAQEPDYKVIWGSIIKNPRVPWGVVVEIDIE